MWILKDIQATRERDPMWWGVAATYESEEHPMQNADDKDFDTVDDLVQESQLELSRVLRLEMIKVRFILATGFAVIILLLLGMLGMLAIVGIRLEELIDLVPKLH